MMPGGLIGVAWCKEVKGEKGFELAGTSDAGLLQYAMIRKDP